VSGRARNGAAWSVPANVTRCTFDRLSVPLNDGLCDVILCDVILYDVILYDVILYDVMES
jgi:hypothetical protein